MKLTVKSLDNKKVKDVEVPDAVFDYPFKEHLVHTAVQSYLNAGRSGSASTKPRGQVRRFRAQTLPPEGHGSGARGFREIADPDRWWNNLRPEAAGYADS